MNKTGRLVRIVFLLQAYDSLTAAELSGKLEVTARTIYRDIETLVLWGLPIVAVSGPEGGYSLPEGYTVDPEMFTSAQATVLGTGGSALGMFTDLVEDPSEIEIANAKLLSVLPNSEKELLRKQLANILFDNSRWYRTYVHKDILRTLKHAVINDQRIAITYHEREDPEQKTIEDAVVDPYGLVFKSDTWYLVGYSRNKSKIRRWNITRISRVAIQNGTFSRPKHFQLRDWWKKELEAFGEGTIRVMLSIQKKAWHRFARVGWKKSNRFFEAGDFIIVELMVDRYEWIIDLVTINRGEVEVLFPQELRDKLAEIGGFIKQRHSSHYVAAELEAHVIDFEAISVGRGDEE